MTDELYSALKEGALGKLRPRPAGSCALKRRAGGFTLLELLVVVTIIASLAALVVGTFDSAGEQAELVVARANLSTVREAISGSASAPGYLADMKHVPGFERLDIKINDLLTDNRDSDLEPEVERYDVVTNRGWRGPYVRAPGVQNYSTKRSDVFPGANDIRFADDKKTFGERHFFDVAPNPYYRTEGVDLAIGDPWGNPIVIQIPTGTLADAERFQYARVVCAGPDGVLDTPLDDPLAGMDSDGTTERRDDDLVLFLNRADVAE